MEPSIISAATLVPIGIVASIVTVVISFIVWLNSSFTKIKLEIKVELDERLKEYDIRLADIKSNANKTNEKVEKMAETIGRIDEKTNFLVKQYDKEI